MKIKNERLFVFFHSPEFSTVSEAKPNDIGRLQFKKHQSIGEYPTDPDDYFILLSDGKRYFDLMSKEYLATYIDRDLFQCLGPRECVREWAYCLLEVDIFYWRDNLWALRHLLKWWQKEIGYPLPDFEASKL